MRHGSPVLNLCLPSPSPEAGVAEAIAVSCGLSEEGGMPPSRSKIVGGNGHAALAVPEIATGTEALAAERCLDIHRLMVRSRALEERMIKMSKSGEGYFWIGGPGEEGLNPRLRPPVKKGQGPRYDHLHPPHRKNARLGAVGMPLHVSTPPVALI